MWMKDKHKSAFLNRLQVQKIYIALSYFMHQKVYHNTWCSWTMEVHSWQQRSHDYEQNTMTYTTLLRTEPSIDYYKPNSYNHCFTQHIFFRIIHKFSWLIQMSSYSVEVWYEKLRINLPQLVCSYQQSILQFRLKQEAHTLN